MSKKTLCFSWLAKSTLLSACLTTSLFSFAEEENVKKAKCHVELLGGGTTIYYGMVTQSQFEQLRARLPGRTIRAAGFDKPKEVFKTLECAWNSKRFQSAVARNVERKQVK